MYQVTAKGTPYHKPYLPAAAQYSWENPAPLMPCLSGRVSLRGSDSTATAPLGSRLEPDLGSQTETGGGAGPGWGGAGVRRGGAARRGRGWPSEGRG